MLRVIFFFNDTATTEIYTLSLHDALPISRSARTTLPETRLTLTGWSAIARSEEHTSELQSQFQIVCRLLLEKKNTETNINKLVKKNIKQQKKKFSYKNS